MSVTKYQIVTRGITNCCPNCGQHTLFPSHSLRVNRSCPVCGTGFDRGAGFYLGPWVLNYTLVVFGVVLPAIVLGLRGSIPWGVATTLVALGCVLLPALIYRGTWSWWLMLYFYFLPYHLPANGGAVGIETED